MSESFIASIVIVTGDSPERMTRSLSCLRRQSIADQLELIIITAPEYVEDIRKLRLSEYADFVVEAGDLTSSARGRAQAVRMARGKYIIFGEDHAFPGQDTWAERIVAALERDDISAAAAGVQNANPATSASWATQFMGYTFWSGAFKDGPATVLPSHNSSYPRDLLLQYGEELELMLESEGVMQADLRSKGHKFWVDGSVHVEHMNFSRLGPSIWLHYLTGRLFAGYRSLKWGWPMRILYAIGAPAIVVKRLFEIGEQCFRNKLGSEFLRALPLLLVFLVVNAVGEAVGYLFGVGNIEPAVATLEYERWRNVLPDEATLQERPAT